MCFGQGSICNLNIFKCNIFHNSAIFKLHIVVSDTIKLFTEKYLGGKVRFESREPTGTLFQVMLPYPSFTGGRQ